MERNQKQVSLSGIFVLVWILLNAVVVKQGFIDHADWYALLLVTVPLLLVSIFVFKRRQG